MSCAYCKTLDVCVICGKGVTAAAFEPRSVGACGGSGINLRDRVAELIEQHGSLRAAARALGVNAGYLHRLGTGEKSEPSELLLRHMGLSRTVTYHRIPQVRTDAVRKGAPHA